nr:transcription/translation regulatory transformer protein RfaH [Gammaproteobacteria bacterium]
MRAWYLVFSKPRQEQKALVNLQRQGYESYLPLMHNRRKRYGRYAHLIEPMFPRYLFIHLSDRTDNWGPIRSTTGVTSMVRFGDRAGRVPDDLVTILKLREGDKGYFEPQTRQLRKGDSVRICEGPMSGYEGIFHCHSGKQRVTLLLEITGRVTKVQIAPDHIELVSRSHP